MFKVKLLPILDFPSQREAFINPKEILYCKDAFPYGENAVLIKLAHNYSIIVSDQIEKILQNSNLLELDILDPSSNPVRKGKIWINPCKVVCIDTDYLRNNKYYSVLRMTDILPHCLDESVEVVLTKIERAQTQLT